jgi:hypothetical protein
MLGAQKKRLLIAQQALMYQLQQTEWLAVIKNGRCRQTARHAPWHPVRMASHQ